MPSYGTTNYNTNWDVQLKCLTIDAAYDNTVFENYEKPVTWDKLAVTHNPVNCTLRLTVNGDIFNPNPATLTNLTGYFGGFATQYPYNPGTGVGYYDMNLGYNVGQTYFRNNYYNGKYALNGTLNVVKASNQLTLTFSNSTDYDLWVAEWVALIASPVYTEWTTFNNTQLSYFTYICFPFWLVETSCGDTSIRKLIHTAPDCIVTYANNVVNITLTTLQANNMPTDACYTSARSYANQMIGSINATTGMADFNLNTVCRDGSQSWAWRYDLAAPGTTGYMYGRFMNQTPYFSGWGMPSPLFCRFNPTTLMFFYMYYFKIVITNTDYPADNYEVYDLLNYATGCDTYPNGVLVLAVVNGIRTYPVVMPCPDKEKDRSILEGIKRRNAENRFLNQIPEFDGNRIHIMDGKLRDILLMYDEDEIDRITKLDGGRWEIVKSLL